MLRGGREARKKLVFYQQGNSRYTLMLNLNLTHLIDDAKCYETVRQMRWQSGVCCPKCNSLSVIKRGKDETQAHRQRYQCKACGAHFDDLSDTIFAGHHQPLRMWILCLYLMGLNNRESANCPRVRPG